MIPTAKGHCSTIDDVEVKPSVVKEVEAVLVLFAIVGIRAEATIINTIPPRTAPIKATPLSSATNPPLLPNTVRTVIREIIAEYILVFRSFIDSPENKKR